MELNKLNEYNFQTWISRVLNENNKLEGGL